MSERLDIARYLRRVIIACWVVLLVCLTIKFFGANIFDIVCTNGTVIAICDYADNHLWANFIISVVYCFVSLYFFILAILQELKYKRWQLLTVILTVLVGTAIKLWNAKIGIIFDVWQGIAMPILFLGKQYKKYWKVLVANVLLVLFQLVSVYIKNTNFYELYDSNLFAIIYGIDVVIMVVLYYAYANTARIQQEIKNGGNK